MSEQTATGAVQTGLFPDNREVLTRKTTQNNVTFRDGGVGVRIYLGNILIVNNIAEIGGKGFPIRTVMYFSSYGVLRQVHFSEKT